MCVCGVCVWVSVLWYISQYDHDHVSRMSERLVKGMMSRLDHVIRNGDDPNSYPGMHDGSIIILSLSLCVCV